MKILVTGATGLIGKLLVKKLVENGHTVNQLVRKRCSNPNEYYWDYSNQIIDEKALENIDSIIHLAGASIAKKWTRKYKKEIISSRVDSAKFLLNLCKLNNIRLKSYITASGVNFYGTFTSDKIFTENDSISNRDFLSQVCEKWENISHEFKDISERVVAIRLAPVLSKNGGTWKSLDKITQMNLASGLGSGKQWFNWIHITDAVEAFALSVDNSNFYGAYNLVADEAITQRDMMKKIAKSKNKFFVPINVPAFIMKLILGEMSEIVLEGSRVSNKKIKDAGFKLLFPSLDMALMELN